MLKEEQPEQVEVFAKVLDKSLAFKSSWAVWEHYEGGSNNSYESSLKKVAWFDDAISFAQAWVNLPHRDLSNFFYDSSKKTVQM